jgi:hypothetical protein
MSRRVRGFPEALGHMVARVWQLPPRMSCLVRQDMRLFFGLCNRFSSVKPSGPRLARRR